MAELDALGQVALGREGSGLAQVLGGGNFNPAMFAAIPKQAYEQQTAVKQKRYETGIKDITELKPEGLNEDIIKTVVPEINATKKMFSDYWSKGIDPSDPKNVDAYLAFQKQKANTQGLIEAAKQKKELYGKAYDLQMNNADDTKFDRIESEKRLNEYYNTPLKDIEGLKRIQNEGILVPAYNFEKHTRDELFKGVPYLAAEINNPVSIGNGMMKAEKIERVNVKDIENRTSKVLDNPTTFKERKFNEELDRLVNSAQPLYDPTKKEIVGFTTGNDTYDASIAEARAQKGFDKLSQKEQFAEMKKAVAIGIAKEIYPDKKDANFHYPSKTNVNVNIGGDKNSGDLIPTFINNRVKETQAEIKNNPGKYTIDQQWDLIKEKVGGNVLKDQKGNITGIRLSNPANMGQVFITSAKNQVLSLQGGKFRPTKGVGTIPGEYVGTDWVYKDKNGVTTTPNNKDAIAYYQIEMKPIRATTDSDIDKAMGNFIMSDPNAASITKEAFKKMLKNSEDIQGNYKIEYRADDPVGQAQVSELVYGSNVVSNAQFNKAKDSNDPSQVQPAGQKAIIPGLFNTK